MCFISEFFKTLRNIFFIDQLWKATSILGKNLKNFTIYTDLAKYLTTLTVITLKFWCSYEAVWKPYLEHDSTFFRKVFSLKKSAIPHFLNHVF